MAPSTPVPRGEVRRRGRAFLQDRFDPHRRPLELGLLRGRVGGVVGRLVEAPALRPQAPQWNGAKTVPGSTSSVTSTRASKRPRAETTRAVSPLFNPASPAASG